VGVVGVRLGLQIAIGRLPLVALVVAVAVAAAVLSIALDRMATAALLFRVL